MKLLQRQDEKGNEIKPPVIPTVILGAIIVLVIILESLGIIS